MHTVHLESGNLENILKAHLKPSVLFSALASLASVRRLIVGLFNNGLLINKNWRND
jgi:hypothetical protein